MIDPLSNKLDNSELKGFAHSMSELHWLLLVLVVLYFFIPTEPLDNSDTVITCMVAYMAFILVFRYFGFRARETRLKLAIETWAMIGFITTILWNTGYTESPLLNLYLLVIITCAITLGKSMTLLELLLIACCYLHMGFNIYSVEIFSPQTFTMLMARFAPFLLVAYVTSLLASDIILAKQKITLLSQTDELTGVLNLRAFNLLLENEIEKANRYRKSFCILMVDVDNLKGINDHYGHTAGSRMIQMASHTLKNCARASDIVARYGGDEFVILMPHTGMAHAVQLADRVLQAIANISFDIDGKHVATTASIGVAGFPECTADPAGVLDMADMALYCSKHAGRNRVSCHPQLPQPVQSVSDISHRHARRYA